MIGYTVSRVYDPDLVEAREQGRLGEALAAVCVCGHQRHHHFGATGALASFGGTACQECWTCGTFTAATA